MRNFHTILLPLGLLLFSSVATASEDAILTVRPDGSIPEIPTAFGPVSLKISGLGTSTTKMKFQSGGFVNDLPSCVTGLIKAKRKSDVLVTGFWHHEQYILPDYVSVHFEDAGQAQDLPYKSSLTITFNLRTAEVIEIRRFSADISGNGVRHAVVDLPSGCLLHRHAA